MHGPGKSDDPIVPKKALNKEGRLTPVRPDPSAEESEGRGSVKRNPPEHTTLRTQGRDGVHQVLARIRQAAQRDRDTRFTALLHHVYNPDRLGDAYLGLKREAAAGIDGQTWHS
jgi:hypothetical protein